MSGIPHFKGRAAFLLHLQRLMEQVTEQVDDALAQNGLSVTTLQTACIQVLHHRGAASLAELAAELGISHQLISHRINGLTQEGWVESGPDPRDARKRVVALTRAGKEQAERLQPFIQGLDAAYADLFDEIGMDLDAPTQVAKACLHARPIAARFPA